MNMDGDDDYNSMEGSGKKKYANAAERTKDKYGDAAHDPKHALKGDPRFESGMNKKDRKC